MKQPPGLWLLLSAGVLWLCVQDVWGVRATSLIFAKTTTTTTESSGVAEAGDEDGVTEPSQETASNTTKPTLTGNPQIDYIFDPNLPRELNGYNLSHYPFYSSMPEDIDFKCDGLHDGFYASVPHKCQVYHHCLFGTRFDFLCANYTAFDQKTFICHFVSEVDCNNSHKYWHRNDALYQVATTTTLKPITLPPTPPPTAATRRPPPRRRRPYQRRPYDDYEEDYDDDEYYDLPPRPRGRRRKHPRPRRPPVYDDDYEEEYEDHSERRGPGRRHGENGERKSYDRRDYDDRSSKDEEEERRPMVGKHSNKNEDDHRHSDETKENKRYKGDDKETSRKRPSGSHDDEDTKDYEHQDERRTRPSENDRSRKGQRRPASDYYYEDEEEDVRNVYKPDKHPEQKDTESKILVKPLSTSSVFNQPRKPPRIRPPVPKNAEDKFGYKPTISKSTPKPPMDEEEEYYDEYEEEVPARRPLRKQEPTASESRRTRKPDRDDRRENNKRPVGSSGRNRGHVRRPSATDDYYDYYEDEKPRSPPSSKRHRYDSEERGEKLGSRNRKRPSMEYEYTEEEPAEEKIVPTRSKVTNSTRKHQEPRFVPKEIKSKPTTTTTTTSTTTTTTTTTIPPSTTTIKERPEPVIRVVKRPFTPNRNRDHQNDDRITNSDYDEELPLNKPTEYRNKESRGPPRSQITEAKVSSFRNEEEVSYRRNNKPSSTEPPVETYEQPYKVTESKESDSLPLREIFKPSPVIIKVPVRSKYIYTANEQEDDFRPVSNQPPVRLRQSYKNKNVQETTTSKQPERNPLDIIENEYDVTLNDALNPTIPNLPVRGFPTGFNAAHDYTYSAFTRPRYDTSLDQNTRYQTRASSQRVETVQPFTNPGDYGRYTNPPEVYQPQNFRRNAPMQRYFAY